MEKYGFIYIWYDRKEQRFYLGKHWGYIDDKYVCSSPWMKRNYRNRPFDFKRRILATNINDKKSLTETERRWLSQISSEELGTKYYNLNRTSYAHGSNNISKETRLKLSVAGKGKKHSPEHSAKVAEANRGKKRSDNFKEACKDRWKGKTWVANTPERAAKISASLTGKPLSEEHKAKMRGKRKPQSTPEEKYRLAEIRKTRYKEKRLQARLNRQN